MKGGERMLHIIVEKGIVVQVIKLSENPDNLGTILQEEFDYKVEYLDHNVEGE